jgi:glycosyltransferase involved in cell wall biosynthesis/serine acetyltransferase
MDRAYHHGVSVPEISVVIATYNRQDLLRRLLEQLDAQTLDPSRYEVVAVDDGSKEDTRATLSNLRTRYVYRIERQENAGAAAARQRGVELASGRIIVFLDDDMQVKPDFLEQHLKRHESGPPGNTVVLGRLRPDAKLAEMPLFERFYARVMKAQNDELADGKPVRGHNIYTGNVSMPKALFLRAGGFDPQFRALEDEELGVRLEKAGATFAFANEAESVHGSDWTSMKRWMDRAYRDGIYQTKLSKKHPDMPESSPWRFVPNLNPVSRPFMKLALNAPKAASVIASTAIRTAETFDKVGLEPIAIAGMTFVYGMQYYRGVRSEVGSAGDARREYAEFRRGISLIRERDSGSAFAAMRAAIAEDHRVLRMYGEKYDDRVELSPSPSPSPGSFAGDAVRKIGFQLMIAYRVMRAFRAAGLQLGAQFMSRTIRHAFSSDVHWDADLEPGIMIVHGFGLAISYAARARHGCILFQNVTLGYGPDPKTTPGIQERAAGAPLLERNVHVGIGATLYGPIVVGEASKLMAGCVLAQSVPPRSIVEAPVPNVAARAPAGPRV